MRRTLLALALVAAAGVAGALAYSSLTTEREFVRLVAAGDEAAAADRPFEALEAYSGALALVPDAMVPYLKRGRVYQQQGQPRPRCGTSGERPSWIRRPPGLSNGSATSASTWAASIAPWTTIRRVIAHRRSQPARPLQAGCRSTAPACRRMR
jgi:hypothetical protein